MVRGAVAAALRAAVQFCERTDADVFAEVDVARDGGWLVRVRMGLEVRRRSV